MMLRIWMKRCAVVMVAVATILFAANVSRADDFPLSLQLAELERDLASEDYARVLKTMIPTDLAAEWQRVATPDNYLLFAREHGGVEQVERQAALKAAYERRKEIAAKFLEMIRGAY